MKENKKILIGICGAGLGHSLRQLPIIEYFIEKGCEIILFCFDQSLKFYKDRFNGIEVFDVSVIWTEGGPDGIDFLKSSRAERNTWDNLKKRFDAYGRVQELFSGGPDLVISDFEFASVQFSYYYNCELITLDQQSKFLGYNFEDIDGFSASEEKKRLRFFVPKAQLRIATSFYKIDKTVDPDFSVKIIPPIIRPSIRVLQKIYENLIVGYFSPYESDKFDLSHIASVLSEFSQFQFLIFNNKLEERKSSNVSFSKYNASNFEQALSIASAAICNAGHTLISELMYLNIPCYIIPFDTYDQQCCANVIDKNGFGIKATDINSESVRLFLENIEVYRENIKGSSLLYHDRDGLDELKIIFEKKLQS
ncbi:glycosyltransferase family protein [Chitinophaga pinensis]|uniref:Uncharacterized protein n=1 Tax=Chitinophaga pinensis (strain ATCC 43595 / DSM 2588 / LMG 13176 / NBRC 15968 / NCIMB 11800 / UQM 2034) TaxID=485918 RepID=A0A979H044_CHIPD|nr:glycosyltransferase family protein [Chitinophaga pinensis]ACU63080.1 hypothetical protein Cpin_5656 [Chitinophaga pinensis DSM 2588]